jgi:hypothetical protein
MKKGVKDLLAEANGRVKTYTVDEVKSLEACCLTAG